jgi:alpha-1,6-mannosyltransferase
MATELDKSGFLRSARLRALPFVAIVLHAVLCPYTKVEESFSLQATHDLVYRRDDLGAYDHLEFPGVVPRTFLPPLALAAAVAPAAALAAALGLAKWWVQLAARLCLGAASAASLSRVGRAVDSRFGKATGGLFALLCAAQFHLPFYASRTLPNTFALLFTNLSLALWLEGAAEPSLLVLVPAIVVLRAELVLWLAALGLALLAQRSVRFWRVLRRGLGLGLASLALSALVDSWFWRRVLWPEGELLLFNLVRGGSAQYGVSPWHWYLSSALPRALLGAAPLSALGAALEPRARALVAVPLLFVCAYSLLPHKELRFVLYAVPPLNVAAALGGRRLLGAAAQVGRRSAKRTLWPERGGGCGPAADGAARAPGSSSNGASPRAPAGSPKRARLRVLAARAALAALALGTCAATALASAASRRNYPGAHALLALHELAPAAGAAGGVGGGGAVGAAPPLRVHIDAAAAIAGISLFLQDDARFSYSKAEGAMTARELNAFTHLVSARERVAGFSLVHAQLGYARLQRWPPALVQARKLYVHEHARLAAARRRLLQPSRRTWFGLTVPWIP